MSHANATDLGLLSFQIEEMAKILKVNVFTYDYTGYGESDKLGKPSPAALLADADAAFEHLTTELKVRQEDIVLYGQSLGSCATCHLVSKHRVRGAIIHSGLASVMRVLDPGQDPSRWYDFFTNVDLIKNAKAPVFIIHGTEDEAVPFSHGKMLWKAAKLKIEPWFVPGGDHNNIEANHFVQYYKKVRSALEHFQKKQFNPEVKNIGQEASRKEASDAKDAKEGDAMIVAGGTSV
jgi:abhydrolase domain-containing protein 17